MESITLVVLAGTLGVLLASLFLFRRHRKRAESAVSPVPHIRETITSKVEFFFTVTDPKSNYDGHDYVDKIQVVATRDLHEVKIPKGAWALRFFDVFEHTLYVAGQPFRLNSGRSGESEVVMVKKPEEASS